MSILRRKLAAAIDPLRSFEVEDERHYGGISYRAAAVLIPITDRKEPGVILTKRPEFLRSHGGQVAFPGGKIDAQDADETAAALREAHEELALPPHSVDIVGTTDVYYSGSGYRITPVVGIVPADLDLIANPQEVEHWFEVPLQFLIDPANAIQRQEKWQGTDRTYLDMQWSGNRIWGVTAGIIANFARRLRMDETVG
jgi:8-oxo-dGTP pyrophosphatase MutT (NUDIX family)